VTLAPMVWLVTVTMTASFQKIFHPDPRIGFLAGARQLAVGLSSGAIPAAKAAATHRLILNQRLNAAVTAVLAGMVLVLVVEALYEWYRILSGRKVASLQETPHVPTQWAEAGG